MYDGTSVAAVAGNVAVESNCAARQLYLEHPCGGGAAAVAMSETAAGVAGVQIVRMTGDCIRFGVVVVAAAAFAVLYACFVEAFVRLSHKH